MDENTTAARHTCLKLDLVGDDPKTKDAIFVKGTWLASHFQLSFTDGLHAWCCQEVEVAKRAAQWDQSIEEYNEMVERHLGFQQPGSVYRFEDVENGSRREEVVRKTQSCEKLQAEAQKCLDQSERFAREKAEFEQAAFSKFVCLLNSKKAKLRELRDRLSKLKNSGKQTEDEEGSTDKTESFDEGTENEEDVNDHPGTIHVASSSSKSQRRKLQK